MSYPYRFFIARGESLKKIQELLADRDRADQAAEAYRKELGATELNLFLGGSARFHHGAPKGWKVEFIHNSSYKPDPATPEGEEALAQIKKLGSMQFPQIRFSQWLGQYDVETYPDEEEEYRRRKLSAAFEKVGDDYVIHVPVVHEKGFNPALGTNTADYEGWATPPDAEPIKVSEYFNKLERAGKLSNTPRPAPDRKKHSQPALKPV